MVCPRCITSVEDLLRRLNIAYTTVSLGEVELVRPMEDSTIEKLQRALIKLGFELLNDPASRTIEHIKRLLLEQIQRQVPEHFSLQKFLPVQLHRDYAALSRLFSSVEGITIEQFFILQKIEKAKELLVYDEMTISEIAFYLGYSSSQHLSAQFKKITGMTPTAMKALGHQTRKPIDGLT